MSVHKKSLLLWIFVALASGNAESKAALPDTPATNPPSASTPATPGDEALVPPRPRPNADQLREQARMLTPADRQRRLREFREQVGIVGTNRTQGTSLREQLRNLPPAERAERLRQLRQKLMEESPAFAVLTPEEREAKRKEIKERVDAQVTELKQRKADGIITDVEQRRLERMEQMSKRLEQRKVLGPRRPLQPVSKETDPLPPPAAAGVPEQKAP